ncbi:MAG: hypothetical protein ACR2QL_03785 [Woeseiaceae bacterium]
MQAKYKTILSKCALSMVAVLATTTAAQADDVSDSDRMLCSVSKLMLCTEDGECYPASVLDSDVPQFLIVDLKKKKLTSTEASAENRSSDIANVVRENGRTFLQGIENNRPFSILIEDDLGQFTAAIAQDGITHSVFGACTDADIK